MAYMRYNFHSEALGRFVDVSIVYPSDNYSFFTDESAVKPRINNGHQGKPLYSQGMKFQTVYLIHGGGDDDTVPYRYTSVERYAIDNNVMLVTPDVANSFGADTEYGADYCLFITEELPCVMQSVFASSPKREDNFIMGFAMGGNVALSCALRSPEKYAMCIDMSGGIGYTLDTLKFQGELSGDHFRNNFYLHNATFGSAENLPGSKHDLMAVAKAKKESGCQLCTFKLIAGSEEGFIRERVEGDYYRLKELGYDADYTCVPGEGHNMHLWDAYLKKALDELLPLKRKAE